MFKTMALTMTLLLGGGGAAQAAAQTAAPNPDNSPARPAPMTGPQVIQLLDQTVNWYRTLAIQQQVANEPSDLLILYDNRLTANRVIALAFDIARANADILAKQPAAAATNANSSAGAAAAPSTTQSLGQLQDKYTTQGNTVQAELTADQHQLQSAGAKQAVELKAKIAELQGELGLINARKTFLDTLASFASQSDSSGVSAGALRSQIDAMATALPAATNASATAAAAPGAAAPGAAPPGATALGATPAAAPAAGAVSGAPLLAPLSGASLNVATRFGIWDLAANVIKLSEKVATISTLDGRTGALQTLFAQYRAPLVDQLKAMSARGDALATQADTADTATLNATRDQLQTLEAQFKETSALLIPLGKEGVLLDQYRRNLENWRGIIDGQYRDALKTLGVRLGVLLVLLALVFTAAELWRRAVSRYVHDSRRRYQLLLLRRIALWCLVVIIVGFAFASELGSIVTFAGLITAGLAVAMQSVLVSIVGYFFLIGKYGVRIGDRVQIGEVYGEVIELGLVRLHLMELGGHGLSGPTGRVVAFANSIAFTVSSGLFKQIPGVNFAWHDLTLTLPPGIDYAATKEKLLAAVNGALQDSRAELDRQTRELQRTTASSSAGDAQPRVQLSFSPNGVDAHIRYPVHLDSAAELDERVSQALLQVITDLAAAAAPVRAT